MKYHLSVREAAEQDMNVAHDFYDAEQEGLGDRFHNEVAEMLRRIEQNPELYPMAGVADCRKAALGIFPFCIYYLIVQDRIYIEAVHDSRRDPRRWQDRVKR
jgi:toxin ParE1/3/4